MGRSTQKHGVMKEERALNGGANCWFTLGGRTAPELKASTHAVVAHGHGLAIHYHRGDPLAPR